MSYADLVTTRHSVRSYKKTPVEPEKVQAILEAGRLAPSAVNNQPTRVAVCDTPEVLSRVAAATGRVLLRQLVAWSAMDLCLELRLYLSYAYERKMHGYVAMIRNVMPI